MFISKIHFFIKSFCFVDFYFIEILISIDETYILMYVDHAKAIENDGKHAQSLKIRIFMKKSIFSNLLIFVK